jgi:hypothetical protein
LVTTCLFYPLPLRYGPHRGGIRHANLPHCYYSLTIAGADTVSEKLAFNPSKNDGVFALNRFVEYELQRASLMLPALMAGALFIWVAAAAFSRLGQWAEKLVPDHEP